MKNQIILVTILVSLNLINFPTWSCPPLQKSQSVQEQFQWIQSAGDQLTDVQIAEINQILELNKLTLDGVECYLTNSKEISHLNDFLSSIKLQILDLRYQLFMKNHEKINVRIGFIKKLINGLLSKSNHLSRRLGASVRSLFLDEMERLAEVRPDDLGQQLDLVIWTPDIGRDLKKQLNENITQLSQQFQLLNVPTKLAAFFGARAWKPASQVKSRLAQILTDLKFQDDPTLESQLNLLFAKNQKNLLWTQSEKKVQHYLQYVSKHLSENPYLSVKKILQPILDQEIQVLKKDLGESWSLIFPLAGISLEGPLEELNAPIELLDPFRLDQAQKSYAQTVNPMGRLYELVLLKQLTQMWTDVDIVQLQTDLNRLTLLKTSLAIHKYQQKFKKFPVTMNDLLKQKMIPQLPKDYFSGFEIKYSQKERKLWSVGENKNDENGEGDDIILPLKI